MENHKIFKYRRLVVYQHALDYVEFIYSITEKFPKNEEYALSSQIKRASYSIPSNIAEGSSRYSRKEQLYFMEIAFGSLLETVCQAEIAMKLGYITDKDMSELEQKAEDIYKMLSGWRKTLESQI